MRIHIHQLSNNIIDEPIREQAAIWSHMEPFEALLGQDTETWCVLSTNLLGLSIFVQRC